ncbi:MAG TPA: hypothetical protein VI457_03285 [Methylococcaceae bacterium]|nr:hypothetical protein [Methylococcaceae bacterium]
MDTSWEKQSDPQAERFLALLEEIRDNQRLQIERQTEVLTLLREQFEQVEKQFDRNQRLQTRAEELQSQSARLVAGSLNVVKIAIPIIVMLLAYPTWLIFRRFFT